MGCAFSKGRGVEGNDLFLSSESVADSYAGIRNSACGKYDSVEFLMKPEKAGPGKVSETSSILERARNAGLERAVEVLDALGSRMSNLNHSHGFFSGITARGYKISILAFEVANTIAKGANLWKSLSDENIRFLKEKILQSNGVRQLISADSNELLCIAASDKRNELDLFSREVIRFGDLCKDPTRHNLGRYFQRLSSEFSPQKQIKEEVEITMQHLITLSQNTSELYHELHVLDRFEQTYQKMLQEEESLPADREESLMILQSQIKDQKKLVKGLKKKSLWSINLEEVVEKLVDIVAFFHIEILKAFSNTGTRLTGHAPVQNQRLGVCGLALHYANIINQIDYIVCRQVGLPPSARDSLYHGLPTGVKAALRSRLQAFDATEFTVAQITAQMHKTLEWLVPMAENTIRAHQGFGCVGEWANIGTEFNNNPEPQCSISRIQTLYHADKEKTDECILELVVWLHHLVIQGKNRSYGFKLSRQGRYQSQDGTSSVRRKTRQDSAQVCNIRADDVQISEAERELLDTLRSNRMILGRSKSFELVTRKGKRGHKGGALSRSLGNSPAECGVAFASQLDMREVSHVKDGIDR